MEEYLGRKLEPNEKVHHRDGNRSNNSIENLEMWVVQQPSGQRVSDKLQYANKILEEYLGFDNLEVSNSVSLVTKIDMTVKGWIKPSNVMLVWGKLSDVGSASTSELARLLKLSNETILYTVRYHTELFEKSPRLPQDHHTGLRWRIKLGATGPYTPKGNVNKYGYRMYSINGKERPEHRLVMEQHLGRKLLPKENVHHKDGDRLNNDISNLELWSTSQPPGQRVEDLLKWAHEIIQLYGQVKPTPEEPKQESQTPTRYKRPWVI